MLREEPIVDSSTTRQPETPAVYRSSSSVRRASARKPCRPIEIQLFWGPDLVRGLTIPSLATKYNSFFCWTSDFLAEDLHQRTGRCASFVCL